MIMQSYPAIPCFLMSGNEMTAVEMATGARRSLLKPLSQADIRSVVKEIWALQHKDRFESPASFG